mgnify:FL=1
MSRATLLRCAYKLGDVVRRGDDMGLIVKNDSRFYTAQMVTATGSITDTTTNIEIRHYLKLVKLDTRRPRDSRPMLRNLTLEQELLDADDDTKHSLINGYVDRLSETQKK